MTITTLPSKLDDSVNLVFKIPGKVGFFEARYVRREDDYFTCYLSCQSGCDQACRMCHLTATKQTAYVDATYNDIWRQAEEVFKVYEKSKKQAKVVHFSFMARGEPLNCQTILNEWETVAKVLANLAKKHNLLPRFMISTIMPKSLTKTLEEIFPETRVNLYYSIYSMDPKFRKKWLPKAMSAEEALKRLKKWQDHTNQIVRLHWALIKDENDTYKSWDGIACLVIDVGLRIDANLVRYNPYSKKYGTEASEHSYADLENRLELWFPEAKVKTVSRVGEDVQASCGMFVNKEI